MIIRRERKKSKKEPREEEKELTILNEEITEKEIYGAIQKLNTKKSMWSRRYNLGTNQKGGYTPEKSNI